MDKRSLPAPKKNTASPVASSAHSERDCDPPASSSAAATLKEVRRQLGWELAEAERRMLAAIDARLAR